MRTISTKEDIIAFCTTKGYSHFTNLQNNCFSDPEFYSGKDTFVIGETSSGKTLIAMMAIAMTANKRVLYMVPYRALAHQKAKEIEEFFCEELDVQISTSEYRENDRLILDPIANNINISVIIYEKVYLFAALNPNFFDQYDLVVFDEFGLVDDEQRGIKADLIYAWCKNKRNLRLVVLATPNYDWSSYADENRFIVTKSNERPVQLIKTDIVRRKGNANSEKHKFDIRGDSPIINIGNTSGKLEDLLLRICIEHRNLGHRILVFENNRTGIIEKAKALYAAMIENALVTEPMDDDVYKLKERLLSRMQIPEENLFLVFDDLCFKMMLCGISFHSSLLPFELRQEIENDFLSDGHLNIVFATESLAFGLNSGIETVIVADVTKPNGKNGWTALTKNEYMNYIGRAGRLGKCEQGYVYTIIQHEHLEEWDNAISKGLDLIESRLFCKDAKSAAMYLLSFVPQRPKSITIDVIKKEILSLLNNGKLNSPMQVEFLNSIEEQCMLLLERKLIEEDDSSFEQAFSITDKGRKLQGFIIDIQTYDLLEKLTKKFETGDEYYFDYCYELANCNGIIDSSDALFTKKNVQERLAMFHYYFFKLECHLVSNKHISKNLIGNLRKRYIRVDSQNKQCIESSSSHQDRRLRIAIILYLRIMANTVKEIGSACMVGYAAMKRLSEQASYYSDIVRSMSCKAPIDEKLNDKLKMLSLGFFYSIPIDSIGLWNSDSIGIANYKNIIALAKCIRNAIEVSEMDVTKLDAFRYQLTMYMLREKYNALSSDMKEVFDDQFSTFLGKAIKV